MNCLSQSLCTPEYQNTRMGTFSRVCVLFKFNATELPILSCIFIIAEKEFVPLHLTAPLLQHWLLSLMTAAQAFAAQANANTIFKLLTTSTHHAAAWKSVERQLLSQSYFPTFICGVTK